MLLRKAGMAPLRKQLQKIFRTPGGNCRSRFRRYVDIDRWVRQGERLFDLRKHPFGDSSLDELARCELLPSWATGSAAAVRGAMENFLDKYVSHAMGTLAREVTFLDVGEWLFSTDHIAVHYGIQYEGQGLSTLSPGTRGVVLLTLYLGLDRWDRRPLVIDQPEENLDPRSVYDDLRPFFRDASLRRQIVMVTHNANLVVNTDSDQVIVASATRTAATELPLVTYKAGGLKHRQASATRCVGFPKAVARHSTSAGYGTSLPEGYDPTGAPARPRSMEPRDQVIMPFTISVACVLATSIDECTT